MILKRLILASHSSLVLYLPILIVFGSACGPEDSNGPPIITYAKPADFAADTIRPSIKLADGFKLQLWAPGTLLSNAVSISFDNKGVGYVSETVRRKSSDIDIRAHRDWMTEDLELKTVDDTRAFHKRKLATSLSDQNDWLEDLNQDSIRDWRDLEVQSELIRRIWDSNGDGRADASSVFASGFNTLVTGVAAGVLHQGQDVYLTAAPDLWKLQDLDGDGDADQRESLSHGYGVHIGYAGHDMSGLAIGPDGKIYWSIGDLGLNVTDATGKRWPFPNQGAVMRSNPDGSDFEVFAHGLRNTQELAFDAFGNLISVDNDGDHPGEHERFVHIVEGSDSGWRTNWQFGKYQQPNEAYKVWMDERLHVPHFPGQAAYLLPPLALAPNGPAGLAYNPGTALSSKWNNYFFGSYFTGSSTSSKVQAFRLSPKGSSFALADTTDVMVGVVSTGVAFGPDGALFVNDWLDGYAKKAQGRIWRLDYHDPETAITREETKEILAAGMDHRTGEDLSRLMANLDMRVRLQAQFELVKRKESRVLLELASNHEDLFARLHGIWGLGQLARNDSIEAGRLVPFLQDSNPDIRAQAAKMLGDARYEVASDILLETLNDSYAPAKFYSAETLGKLGTADAFDPLISLLNQIGDSDPHLRHAVTFALSKLNRESDLVGLSNHSSLHVRIGAVVALRHMKSPGVASFLEDIHPWVVTEAARAIHDDFSIPEALPSLAQAISTTNHTEEAFLRRAINANLRLGDRASASRLAHYADRETAPEVMRMDALWALGYWASPPLLDRVEGRHRVLPERELLEAQEPFAKIASHLMESLNDSIKSATIEAAGRLRYVKVDNHLLTLLEDKNESLAIRQASLRALVWMESPLLEGALNIALANKNKALREDAQELIGAVDLPESVVMEMLASVFEYGTISEQQKALGSLAGKTSPEAETLLGDMMEQMLDGSLPVSLRLDVLIAVDQTNFNQVKAKKEQYESRKDPENLVEQFNEALDGGDVIRGRQTFYTNPSAQCIRCHKLNGEGGDVGPPLDSVGYELDPVDLLISMISPSSRIAPGYGMVTLEMDGEEKAVGKLMEDNKEFIVIDEGEGKTRKILTKTIKDRKNAPSAMFPMASVLTKSELRDLVAFLSTLSNQI